MNIDTSIAGLARLAGAAPPAWLTDGLRKIQSDLDAFMADCNNQGGVDGAHKLVPIYRETLDLYARIKASDLSAQAKSDLAFELGEKINQFQIALKDLLGLDFVAFTAGDGGQGGPGRGASADESARSVYPGEDFGVRVHTFSATSERASSKTWFETAPGASWGKGDAAGAPSSSESANALFHLHVPADAATH